MLGAHLRCCLLASVLATTANGCFLNGSEYENQAGGNQTSPSGGGGSIPTTTGATGGGTSTPTSSETTGGGGNTGGSGNTGGTGGNTGGGGGTGGTGGSPVEGDVCPGIPSTIKVYGTLVLGVDTTQANDDYGFPNCGGGSAPDMVYQVTSEAKGFLTISIVSEVPYEGFIFVRKECDEPNSADECSTSSLKLPVDKDQSVFVFVDGKSSNPAGKATVTVEHDGCGNGVIEGTEECDDGNATPGDSCVSCKVNCSTEGSSASDHDAYLRPTTNHCYLRVYDPNKSWDNAQAECLAWGGQLAGLSTLEELADLQDFIGGVTEDFWIGGNDKAVDGSFQWINGEQWIYTNQQAPWDKPSGPDEPNGGTNENCVEIYNNGKLNDVSCDIGNNYLCERPVAGAQ